MSITKNKRTNENKYFRLDATTEKFKLGKDDFKLLFNLYKILSLNTVNLHMGPLIFYYPLKGG